MVTKWSQKRALDLSIPPSCTKKRHDFHGTNGFASYGTQNLKFGEAVKILAVQAGVRPYTFSKADEEREKDWKKYEHIQSDLFDHFLAATKFFHLECFEYSPSPPKV